MKIVIFAGGTGKRFWPVSRIDSPKQFLPIDDEQPLVRKAVDRVKNYAKTEDIFISTGKKYEKEIKAILSDIPQENFIFEFTMRDTGPAVTLAAAVIHERFPSEVMGILWADHRVADTDTFTDALAVAETIVKKEGKIVFIAVPARFPSPHRGYIKFKDKEPAFSHSNPKIERLAFEKFVEKPTFEIAVKYIEDGHYAWNPGYWVVKPEKVLEVTARQRPDYVEACNKIVSEGLDKDFSGEFEKLEKISADYAFAELVEADEATVLKADIGWSDVGEWIALKEALQQHDADVVQKGNVLDLDSQDSIIYNYDDSKLISTIGLEGMVVVNTKDVVAIFPKSQNARLKQYLKELEEKGLKQYL